MTDEIFLIKRNNELLRLKSRSYDSEKLLQVLLEKYPDLISGSQIDPSEPRRWLFVAREATIPAQEEGNMRWYVDHLFIDQDGIPTLVEVKLRGDTRIRREVVGQMLDYASNAVAYWPVEAIRAQFVTHCEKEGVDPEQRLREFLPEQSETEEFWQKVKTNLQAGKIRMIFLADDIPPELRRIVEFLNEQMDPAEVLAVELKQYEGEDIRTLVPLVIGNTTTAVKRKKGGTGIPRQWDEHSFMSDLLERAGQEALEVAQRILEWARERKLRIWWGKGAKDGSFFPMFDYKGDTYWLISVWTYGRLEIQFQKMIKTPPFDKDLRRKELLGKYNKVPGISLPEDSIGGRPSIKLSQLHDEGVLGKFLEVMAWNVEEIKKSS